MAKFVISGKADCPYYAKAELLADQLHRNLPDFKVHKIVKDPAEWDDWSREICEKNSWKGHNRSPMIWRELVNRGGKGMYLGDHNDFQEYARDYYGSVSELNSNDLNKIAAENKKTYKIVEEEKRQVADSIRPFTVVITNPESAIGYYIVNEVTSGAIFGAENEISIRLYSRNPSSNSDGLRMEIEDLASDKLRFISVASTAHEAFSDCDFVIALDELSSAEQGAENPYISLAQEIDEFAKPSCKILITPYESSAQTYAIVNVVAKQLKRVNAKVNLIGNSLCDEMSAKAILAHRLKINPGFIKNMFVIGQSVQDSFYIDLIHGEVTDYDGAVWAKVNTHWLNLVNMVADRDWIKKEYLTLLHDRDGLVKEMLGRRGALAFAQSVKTLCRLWCTSKDENATNKVYYSAIVNAGGNYSLKDNVFISLPVVFANGSFDYVKNYKISQQTQSILEEIIRDTKKRITSNYKDNNYQNKTQELKLSIPHVIYE